MEVHLYNRNLTTPVFIEDITSKVEGGQFSTRLNGGFHIFSWRHKADLPEAWDWLIERLFYRVIITDQGHTLWEGRIEDVELTIGYVRVTAYGYYVSLTDEIETTAYNTTADAVIKTMLTDHCPQIASDQTHIEATDTTITSAASADYLDKTPQEIVEMLLPFGDSGLNSFYFAIWEDRIPYLTEKAITTITWQTSLADMVMFSLTHIGGDIANRTYTLYDGVRTAVANDLASQKKYGDGTTPLVRMQKSKKKDVGAVAAAAAQSYRDAELSIYKTIRPRLSDIAIGDRILDTKGVVKPSAWVRAGDVIRVVDLVPTSEDVDTVVLDAKRTFFIRETEYDMDTHRLKIVPDSSISTLDALLSQQRIIS